MNGHRNLLLWARGFSLAPILGAAWASAPAQGILHFTASTPIYYSPLPTTVDLDIDNDGTTDFALRSDGVAINLVPRGASGNWATIATPPDMKSYVVPWPAGTSIAASLEPVFISHRADTDPVGASTVNLGSVGFWANVDAYAGVDFCCNTICSRSIPVQSVANVTMFLC